MASGMDTDSIVKDLMRPQQYKIDKEKKAQALVKLKQDAWKDMNKKLFDFHTKFTHKMSLSSTFNKNTTTSSNTTAMSIDNGATVPPGTHKFEVKELADSAKMAGTIKKKDLTADTKIGDLESLKGESGPIVLAMRIDGKDILVELGANNKISDIEANMNAALKDQGFTAKYDEKNGKFFINSSKTGANVEIALG